MVVVQVNLLGLPISGHGAASQIFAGSGKNGELLRNRAETDIQAIEQLVRLDGRNLQTVAPI